MSEIHGARVDLGGLLKVVGQHLYSSPEVVVRELVQNAHDSCVRRRVEGGDFQPEIEVFTDDVEKTLRFVDNGAGLTHDEVVQYLATVGSGKTREVRASSQAGDLIGQFGLGFLTAYTVASRVEVTTTSHHSPEETWAFSSRDGQAFSMKQAQLRPVGTTVTLHLREEHQHLSVAPIVHRLLRHYCCMLPIPITTGEPINEEPPPWRREDLRDAPPIRLKKVRLDFAERYEGRFRPLCTIPIEAGEGASVRGLLWIQDGTTYGTTDNRQISLFVRGMLISDDVRDLVPRWAGFVGGVLECDELLPTASREDVQRTASFERVRQHVREALISGLREIGRVDEQAWRMILLRHNEALLGASITDDRLFATLRDQLTVPTSEGNLTMTRIRRRGKGALVLDQSGRSGPLWFRALGMPAILGHRYGASAFAARWADEEGVELARLGEGGEQRLLTSCEIDNAVQARLDSWLATPQQAVRVSHFEPSTLPAVVIEDSQALLKQRIESDEADRRISQGVLGLARQFTERTDAGPTHTLILNASNPAVQDVLADGPHAKSAASLIAAFAGLTSSSTPSSIHDTLATYSSALTNLTKG